jgi:hypothetical protein
MAKHSYALDSGGPKRLELSWSGSYSNVTIHVDGSVVGTIPDQKELKVGRDFRLPDGSTLHVQLVRSLMSQEVRLLRDGVPLPGTSADPAQQLRTAYNILFFVGALSLALGVVAVLGQVDVLLAAGIGWESIAEGAAFLVLGYFVRRRSVVALGLAAALLAADTVLTIVTLTPGAGAPVAGIVIRLAFLYYVARGFGALRSLNLAHAAA